MSTCFLGTGTPLRFCTRSSAPAGPQVCFTWPEVVKLLAVARCLWSPYVHAILLLCLRRTASNFPNVAFSCGGCITDCYIICCNRSHGLKAGQPGNLQLESRSLVGTFSRAHTINFLWFVCVQLPARQRVLTAKRLICKAAAAPPAVAAPSDAGRLSAEDRAALAKELGYRSIGADLPDDVTLTQVISSLPREVRLAGHRSKSSKPSLQVIGCVAVRNGEPAQEQ